ncbi:MAG TPA: hypothetical protein VFA03_16800 [Acetobacteraceae bacterium]|nr:hypothetical protein [Acetobacteraceae bacterium]
MPEIGLRSDDADLAVRRLDALREHPEVVAAIAAASNSYPLASRGSELPHHSRRDDLLAVASERRDGSLGFGRRLFASRFEAGDHDLGDQMRIVEPDQRLSPPEPCSVSE